MSYLSENLYFMIALENTCRGGPILACLRVHQNVIRLPQVTHMRVIVFPSWASLFSLSRRMLSWMSSLVRPTGGRNACQAPSLQPWQGSFSVEQRPLVVRGLAERWGSARLGPQRAPPAAAPARAPDQPFSSRARTSAGAALPAQHMCVITARCVHAAGSSAGQLSLCLNGL